MGLFGWNPCRNSFLVGWPPSTYCCETRLMVSGSVGDAPQQDWSATKPA